MGSLAPPAEISAMVGLNGIIWHALEGRQSLVNTRSGIAVPVPMEVLISIRLRSSWSTLSMSVKMETGVIGTLVLVGNVLYAVVVIAESMCPM